MIIRNLHVVNFKSLQDETVEFGKGVTLIRGLNESGKSTIMEAILYALYGYVLRPKANAPISKLIEHNSSRALIQLTFEIAGKTYQVTREIFRSKKQSSKSKLVEILPTGNLQPLGNQSVTEVTNTIRSLLGDISYNELVSSCIVAQKELSKLVDLAAGSRKDVINVFLNLGHFNEVGNRVKDIRRDLLGKREQGGGSIDAEKEKLRSLESERDTHDQNLAEARQKQEKVASMNEDLEGLHVALQSNKILLESLEEYNKRWREKKDLEKDIRGLRGQIEIYERRLEELSNLEGRRDQTDHEYDTLEYIEEATEIVPEIEALVQAYNDESQQVKALKARVEEQTQKIDEQTTEAEKHKPTEKEQKVLQSKVNLRTVGFFVLVVSVLCIMGVLVSILFLLMSIPIIGIMVYLVYKYISRVALQDKSSRYLREKDKLDTLLEGLNDTGSQIEKIESEMDAVVEEMDMRVSTLPGELSDFWQAGEIESANTLLETYEENLNRRNTLFGELQNIDEQLEDKPNIQREVSGLEKEMETKTRVCDAIEFPKLPDDAEFSEELLAEKRELSAELREQKSRIETEIETSNSRIAQLEKYLEQHEGIHDECKNQKKKLEKILEDEKITRVILEALETTSENLRKRVKPNVERYMQQILPAITDNRYKAVRLSETYDVEVWSDGAGEFQEKEMFSGGTEDQFLLAMRIAFALALLPTRKHTRPEFLFLDEPLGSSDVVRREGIMNLTQTVLAESFQQIIIISHVEGLEDYADSIIEVEEGKVRLAAV